MKILCVNQTYTPDVAATAQFLSDLCEQLVAAGHEVTVVCAGRDYLNSNVRLPAHEVLHGVRIERVAIHAFGKERRLVRMLGAALCNLGLLWKMLLLPRHDRIIALTSPPLVAWFALGIARLKKSTLIYWVMDMNPEQAFIAGWLTRASVAGRFLEFALRQVLTHSSLLIPLDRYMGKKLLEKGAPAERIQVRPLWGAPTTTGPAAITDFRRQHGLEGKFVVMYAGNHSICHPLTTLLETALALSAHDALRFVFIGGGARAHEVREWKEQHRLDSIIQLPYCPEEEIEAALSAADVHIVIMGETYVGVVHPSKIYRIMALGKQFILVGPIQSAIGDLITEHNIGSQVDQGDTLALQALLERAQLLPNEERQSQEAHIRSIGQKFAPENAIASLTALITR